MLCKDTPLTAKQFGYNVLSPDFADVVSAALKLLKAPFLFGKYLLFYYDFKILEKLISLFNSDAASREPLIIFIAFMVSPTAN